MYQDPPSPEALPQMGQGRAADVPHSGGTTWRLKMIQLCKSLGIARLVGPDFSQEKWATKARKGWIAGDLRMSAPFLNNYNVSRRWNLLSVPRKAVPKTREGGCPRCMDDWAVKAVGWICLSIPFYRSICLSIYLPDLSIYPCLYPSFFYIPIFLSIDISIYSSVHLSICLSIHPSIYQSIDRSIDLFLYQTLPISACLYNPQFFYDFLLQTCFAPQGRAMPCA